MEMILTQGSIGKFHASLVVSGYSVNTARAYKADLEGLMEFAERSSMEGVNLETVTATYLNRHRAEWKPATTARKLTAFKKWAAWAGSPDFLSDYKPPKPGTSEPHPIPEGIDGVLAMLKACQPYRLDRQALVALTGLCALRVGEAIAVTPEHINLDVMEVVVRGKGDKTRTVPISKLAWKFIRPAYEVELKRAALVGRKPSSIVGLKDRQARATITSLAKKAGLSRHVASHDMRATMATAALDETKDLRAVQEILGHASPTTTQRYTRISQSRMRAAVEAVA